MNAKIMVAIACYNRKNVAELCLPTMRDSVPEDDSLAIFNDGSTEYDCEWLKQFGQPGMMTPIQYDPSPMGIQAQRRLHLKMFLPSVFTHLYFTDHDCIHDPNWREHGLNIQDMAGGAPTCLYDTRAHSTLPGNTIEETEHIIWRRVAPGVSYLLTREHVERLAPHIETLQHFDWSIPSLLGNRFAVSRVSHVDHIGIGGDRHPMGEGPNGGDRATNPTPWLVKKRAEIVAALSR